MIVMKFGGTSVQDVAAIRNAAQIVLREREQTPLIVVSACAGVTNTLIRLAHKSAEGNLQEALTIINALRDRHNAMIDELFQAAQSHTRGENNTLPELLYEQIARDCHKLEELAQSLAVLKELTPRTLDQIAAFGEQWSSLLLSSELLHRGVSTRLVDARKVLITDEAFTSAAPLFEITNVKAQEVFGPILQKETVVVTQGFIGATANGLTTTIGRSA